MEMQISTLGGLCGFPPRRLANKPGFGEGLLASFFPFEEAEHSLSIDGPSNQVKAHRVKPQLTRGDTPVLDCRSATRLRVAF